MKVKEVFEKSVQFFREKNIENSRLEAELLVAHILKTDRVGIYLKYEAPLSESEIKELRDLVMRKSKGEPTAYLIGEKYFYNRSFRVGPGVLIPRPETEFIIEDVLINLKDKLNENLIMADLGSGSGCLGLTLGLEFSNSEVYLVEKSPAAWKYLELNLHELASNDQQNRFNIIKSAVEDWKSEKEFDLIVANPPYIDHQDPEVQPLVRKFEPAEALFADREGLAAISSWLQFVVQFLKPEGLCYFEIGHKQGDVVRSLFQATEIFASVEILKDFSEKDRFIKAVRK